MDYRPTAEHIEQQLEILLRSPHFVGATRLKELLAFLVRRSAREPSAITEREIAVEVFLKKADFNARSSSAVRTAVGRLRSKLREYYNREHANDLLIIEVPEGTYSPSFTAVRLREELPEIPVALTPETEPAINQIEVPEAFPELALRGADGTQTSTPALSEPEPSQAPEVHVDLHSKRRVSWFLAVAAVLAGCVLELNAHSPFAWLLRRARPEIISPVMRQSIALLDFNGFPDQSVTTGMGYAIAEMFRTELSTGGRIRIISGEDVARMERDLSLPRSASLSKNTLSRVRKDIGADYVISGSLFWGARNNGELRIDVRLQDARTGEILESISQSGPEAKLPSVISSAGGRLRQGLRIGSLSEQGEHRVSAFSQKGSEARRLYGEGIQKLRNLDLLSAEELLKRAAQVDVNSSEIYAALSEVWSKLGYETKAKEAARIALRLAAGLPPEQANLLQARYCELDNDWANAAKIYASLWTIFHDNVEYGIRLANAQAWSGTISDAFVTIQQLRNVPQPLGGDPQIDLAEAQIAEMEGNSEHEQEAAARAAEKSQQRGARWSWAEALLKEAWAANILGQRGQALNYAQEARQIFIKLGDEGGSAKALKNIGDVKDDEGLHADARTAYFEALALFRKIGSESGVVVTLNNLGYTYKAEGDLNEARRTFEESLRISRSTGDLRRQAQALNSLATILWRQDDIKTASAMYQESLMHFRAVGDKRESGTLLGNLAILFQDEGRMEAAQQSFEQCLEVLQEVGDRSGEARTLGNLGDLLLLRGGLQGAKQRFGEQLSIGQILSDSKQISYALQGLGEVLTAEGDLPAAEQALNRALQLRKQSGEAGLAAETLLSLAQLQLDKNQANAAEPIARQALSELAAEQEADDEALARALLARSLAEQGRFPEARRMAAEALARVTKSADRSESLFTSIECARVRAACGLYTGALNSLRSSLAEASQYGFVGAELEARLALAEIEVKQKSPAAAAHLQALRRDANESGFSLIAQRAANYETMIASTSKSK